MIINCIAVDDEPAALDLIVSYIRQTSFFNLVGSYNNAIDALSEIRQNSELQLLFLDIRMADLSGIELARIIEQSDRKKNLRIIFTTAYDQYALEGYKVDALDYLLKPFSYVDFSKAANKAYQYFDLVRSSRTTPEQTINVQGNQKQYIYMKVDHQLLKVNIEDILYIEGLKDYVKVYLKQAEKPIITLTSLKRLEEKLPSDSFLRLHRSYIVSTDAIKSATKTSVRVGSVTITVSEQFKDTFNEFLTKWTL